ncbi:MAG: tRNA dihydrouridine synthase DusB [Bacteroidetes bacterium]|nr:tRNA dihydrouridine synthase DusB [Bacteroidota bacterium]
MVKIGNIELGEFPVLLAPMEDITDTSFRRICKQFGVDLMFTEFISSEGLIRNAVKSTRKLVLLEEERPIGIQIFGHDINSMILAAELAEQARPDLIDINFGCPVRKVVSKGAGAAMLKDIPKMIEMTKAVVKSTSLPVTVKTRIGWDEKTCNIVDVAEQLQDTGIKALTIHGRTRSQLYTGKADWTLIGKVKNNQRMYIPVIGNGDIDSPQKALEMKQKYNIDGIMIGRAVIGNPWIFKQIKEFLKTGKQAQYPDITERTDICREHLILSVEQKGERTGVLEMRTHYSGYFKGLENFKQFKTALMQSISFVETEEILLKIKEYYNFQLKRG